MIDLIEDARGVIVPVRAQAGARQNGVIGEHAGKLRVSVSAAPERGKANEAITHVLAEAIGCRALRVRLLSGASSREKRFLVEGETLAVVLERLEAAYRP